MHHPPRARPLVDPAGARADRGAFAPLRSAARDRAVLVGLTLIGLSARVPGIAHQPLQWDEGWSIALARLPVGDALRLTALDVHPPLYYGLLHVWVGALGTTPLAVRALSVLAAVMAVPLAAAAARAWWPADGRGDEGDGARRWAGWVAAVAAAVAPPLVYYAGVGRMYAPAAVGVLAAAWGVAAWLEVGGPRRKARRRARGVAVAVAVAGSAGALLSFYYSGFALAGMGLAALGVRPATTWRRWLAWVGATAGLVAPWLIFALPPLAARMADRAVDGAAPGASVAALMAAGWRALLFVNTGGPVLAGCVAVGLAVALGRALYGVPASVSARGRLAATGLPIVLVCAAVAVGARAHMFAPRYATVATPFVALGIGWAAAGAVRRRWTVVPAIVALVAAAWPTLSGAIYARSAEWFEAYDPGAIHRAVAELARPGDVVAFNILSMAGAYDSAAAAGTDRDGTNDTDGSDGGSPSWTYAQLWDPVHEPVKPAIRRVEDAYETALRGDDVGTAALWLALYKGTAASDTASLKAWADDELFPTAGRWVGDTLLVGYVDAPTDRTRAFEPAVAFGDGIVLRRARYTSTVPRGGNVAVALRWRADAVPAGDARVVVRLVDSRGRTVAQRDAVPVGESRPTSSWGAGETLDDRHGLRLPMAADGPVRIVVGLVDAAGNALGALVDVGWVSVGAGMGIDADLAGR
ncbi:MAG: hypothetical protein IT332_07735 [Ardenticatenales bacterium]|nr:hypothetical protein [Ardenticatenales bacterium]